MHNRMNAIQVLNVLQVQKEAIQSVEQDGMVFIDEIDKIVVGSEMRYGTCNFTAQASSSNTSDQTVWGAFADCAHFLTAAQSHEEQSNHRDAMMCCSWVAAFSIVTLLCSDGLSALQFIPWRYLLDKQQLSQLKSRQPVCSAASGDILQHACLHSSNTTPARDAQLKVLSGKNSCWLHRRSKRFPCVTSEYHSKESVQMGLVESILATISASRMNRSKLNCATQWRQQLTQNACFQSTA